MTHISLSRTAAVAATLLLAVPNFASAAPTATLTQNDIAIDAGALGKFALSYPHVNGAKPSSVAVAGNAATLQYAGGAAIALTLHSDAVSFRFASAPDGIKDYKLEMNLPIELGANGATWTIKDKSGVFPREFGGAKLFQGNAGDLAVAGAGGASFAIRFPENYAWTELQDNREWNWSVFVCMSTTPFNRDKQTIVIPFGDDAAKFDATMARFAEKVLRETSEPKENNAPRLSINFKFEGLDLDCGPMGKFKISYPILNLGGDDNNVTPVEMFAEGIVPKMCFRYKNGIEAAMFLSDKEEGEITIDFHNVPPEAKSFRMEMFVPFNYNDGGGWAADTKNGVFPKVYNGNPKLFQGHSKTLKITDENHLALALDLCENAYLEVQDNRAWGWTIFHTQQHVNFQHDQVAEDRERMAETILINPDKPQQNRIRYTMKIKLDASQFQRVKIVDRFGQVPRDFPGKIKDEAEMAASIADETAFYASLKEARKLNRFGGLAGSGAKLGLKKTGFFNVQKIKAGGGRETWTLVDPEGDAYFHLGICCFGGGDDFTTVEGRRDAFEWLPPRDEKWGAAWKDYASDGWWSTRAVSFYVPNIIRKFGKYDHAEMSERHIDRVRAIGFNGIGAFTGFGDDLRRLYAARSFPYVRHLSYGDVKMVPSIRGVFDPFDPATAPTIDAAFARHLAPYAAEPLVIGYYLENEQQFENIPRAVPALDKTSAAKRELVRRLRAKYNGIDAFNAAWALDAKSFDELEDRGLPLNTKAAFEDMREYNEAFLEAYYKVIHDAFRKHDPNHMLIGNRWQPSTANSEPLCRIAGKYNDVISINYYASAVDKEFVTRIYNWTGGKPQFWSEFYFTATKESNAGPSGLDLDTQRERGLAYRNYVEQGASLGFVAGVEWFVLNDQAATGRFFEGFNGERANTGLINVTDSPYKDMLVEMRKTHNAIYDILLNAAAPFSFDDSRYKISAGKPGGKYSAGRATARIATDGKQDGYPLRPPERIPSSRLVIGRDADGLEGAFKIAWDDERLHILIAVTDKTPMQNTLAASSLWNADCVEIFIGSEHLDQAGAMLFTDRQILLGAGATGQFYVPNVAAQPDIKTAVIPNIDGKGYILEASIPWQSLDIAPQDGMELLFDIGLDNSDVGDGRTAQIMWNGGVRNSSDRSHWGRLILAR